jgi:hypothetical protein
MWFGCCRWAHRAGVAPLAAPMRALTRFNIAW